jgi:hypothetical protein
MISIAEVAEFVSDHERKIVLAGDALQETGGHHDDTAQNFDPSSLASAALRPGEGGAFEPDVDDGLVALLEGPGLHP